MECPNCGNDNAYFDGVECVCPDCDYTWSDPDLKTDEEEWDEAGRPDDW